MTMQIENLTDEEILNMQSAPIVPDNEPSDPTPNPVDDQPTGEDEGTQDEGVNDAADAEGGSEEVQKPETEDLSDEALGTQQAPSAEEKTTPIDPPVEDKKEEAPAATTEADPKPASDAPTIDYAAEYAKLVGAPIKANGKEITLKSTDEVLRLVQQGANYNKRMEELKPARKAAAMLENAGLLGDEAAVSQMIDLYNGKHEAIAKMIKDLNIDIYALDLDSASKYTPTSHLQTDEQVIFQDTLKEVRSLEGGQEAMTLIDSWDRESKELIWGNATAVRQIYDYKQSGVYDTVATEVERRKALGQIPPGTPFITAFTQVGNDLAAQAEAEAARTATVQQNTVAAEPAKPAARTPVATGIAPRKPETPDARAAAAASPRGGAAIAKAIPDIFNMSDADIEKMTAPPV